MSPHPVPQLRRMSDVVNGMLSAAQTAEAAIEREALGEIEREDAPIRRSAPTQYPRKGTEGPE